MKIQERHKKIINLIQEKGRVNVEDFVSLVGVSIETIRRDLSKLANEGKIQKFHGGASLPTMQNVESSFQKRINRNITLKNKIAKKAVQLIKPNDTIFIDTGSTTIYFAKKIIGFENLTVITNSTEVAKIVSSANPKSKVFLLGGLFAPSNQQTVGELTIKQAKMYRANQAFITVGGVDCKDIMDFNYEEAEIAKTMIGQSEKLNVLASNSKVERVAPFRVGSINKIDNFITNKKLPVKLERIFKKNKINIIYPKVKS